MPPKKSAGGQKAPPQEQPVLPDGGDPALVAMAIVDKKKRNLEKRKNKLESLRDNLESGSSRLDKDQLAAVAKLDEVGLQLELIRDLQKQFTTLQSDYQKSRKKQQKADRLAAKESEREAERRVVAYTLRVQDILNNMGDDDKENFRGGSNGAVLLSDTELSQLDDLYRILTPTRQGNSSFQADLENASEFIQQIVEQSTKEVLGTTYKQLYELLKRVDECGYFDHTPSDQEEDEESQEEGVAGEGVADDDDYKSAEDNTPGNETDGLRGYESTTPTTSSAATMESSYMPPVDVMPSQQQPTDPVVQPDMLMGYIPSAPSPTFPGLGPSPIQPTVDGGGFSFMHESEVDRGGIQAMQQPPSTLDSPQINSSLQTDPQMTAPPMNFKNYPLQEDRLVESIVTPDGNIILPPSSASAQVEQAGTADDLATTDVATGQPNQSTDSYQGALGNAGGNIMTTAPPPSSYQYGGGAMGDPSTGYQNQYGAPVRVGGQPPRGNRGGRGSRGGGPGPNGSKSSGGMYRNGRGMQGGYDVQTGPYGGNRGYAGGGHQRSGRPNYRGGGPRK